MEMRIVSTSLGASYQGKYKNIGFSAFTGLYIESRIGKSTTIYVLSKPFNIGTDAAGVFGFTALTTGWFNVNTPKSDFVLTSLENAMIQLELSMAMSKIDIKFTVYNEDSHPTFSFEKINVPVKGLNTSSLRVRGRLKRASTKYKIVRPKKQ